MSEYIVYEWGYPGQLMHTYIGELVRCKDCKHGRPYKHTTAYVECKVDGDPIDRDSDFFCRYGERREDEQ